MFNFLQLRIVIKTKCNKFKRSNKSHKNRKNWSIIWNKSSNCFNLSMKKYFLLIRKRSLNFSITQNGRNSWNGLSKNLLTLLMSSNLYCLKFSKKKLKCKSPFNKILTIMIQWCLKINLSVSCWQWKMPN